MQKLDLEKEWIDTNGLGGYASSTINNVNTRKYHGLLVASLNPPVDRQVLVSKVDEEIEIHNTKIELGTNQYTNILHPKGYEYLKEFTLDLYPTWKYLVNESIQINKSIILLHEKNTTIIKYQFKNVNEEFTFNCLPFIACRDFHTCKKENDFFNRNYTLENNEFIIKPYNEASAIHIKILNSNFLPTDYWYKNFEYEKEKERGLDFKEDLYNPGKFIYKVKTNDVLWVILSSEEIGDIQPEKIFSNEVSRRKKILSKASGSKFINRLELSANQFLVKKGDKYKSIIAGYHWFSDWGRDTMISLPGICLVNNKLKDAEKILESFALFESEGMIPNRFPDNEKDIIEYNTVDASLWYFIAVYKYLNAGGNKQFVLNKLLPTLKNIVDWHFKGTRYNIKVDSADSLLYSGNDKVQLTWMDAKIDNWVVTPRTGKAVEINALWFNALNIFSEILKLNDQHSDAEIVLRESERVKENFDLKFWNNEKLYLNDVITDDNIDDTLRPNQILALSLPFKIINDTKKSKSILKVITSKLLTPFGLRSLEEANENFRKVYIGNSFERDAAYHQGTVWSWLLGPYIDALIFVDKNKGFVKAKSIVDTFSQHLNADGFNTISEIFDATAPFKARGCIAQAWSVAEILRVIKEYKL